MKKTIQAFFVILTLIPIRAFPQSASFAVAVRTYEDRMNQAAKSWMNKGYGRAVDWFRSAHEVLSEHKPSPSDIYSWRWCMALASYTKLMERLVEIEMVEDESNSDLKMQLCRQAHQWAETLAKRIDEWDEVSNLDLSWIAVRSRWKKRFEPAMRQADQLPVMDSSG